jgi:hypothetical protein
LHRVRLWFLERSLNCCARQARVERRFRSAHPSPPELKV